jgi:hypothetical protein
VFVPALNSNQTVYGDDPHFRYVPSTGTLSANIASLTGNVIGGNLVTGGQVVATGGILTTSTVSATGNIIGSYMVGNGSQLTGLTAGTTIQNGNSNVLIGSSAGNVSINVNGVSPVVSVTPLGETVFGTLSVTGNVTGGNIAGTYITGNGSQLTGLGRSLTIGTRSTPTIISLTAGGSFTVETRYSGNVVITVTTT